MSDKFVAGEAAEIRAGFCWRHVVYRAHCPRYGPGQHHSLTGSFRTRLAEVKLADGSYAAVSKKAHFNEDVRCNPICKHMGLPDEGLAGK